VDSKYRFGAPPLAGRARLTTVQDAMRNVASRPAAATCPACGRPILADDAVRLQGARFHRRCAYYSARRATR
jgi:hypothetical protein